MEHRSVVIIPAYNEAKYIASVLRAIREHPVVGAMRVVVIDDGSTDETVREAQAVPGVELIRHHRNKGLGAAFRSGVDWSIREKVECMIFFDADGQFAVEDIPRIARPVLENKSDFVIGSRFMDGASPQGISFAKLTGNRALAWFISWVTGVRLKDVACGFRAYSREALLRISLRGEFTYTQEVLLDLLYKGLYGIEVPVSVRYFPDRESTISSNLWKYGWRVFKIITRAIRDYQPMKFFGFVGGSLFLAGLVLDAWLFVHRMQTGAFSPYKVVGFAGAFLNFTGITIWFIGFVADILNRSRSIQEELLYNVRKRSDS